MLKSEGGNDNLTDGAPPLFCSDVAALRIRTEIVHSDRRASADVGRAEDLRLMKVLELSDTKAIALVNRIRDTFARERARLAGLSRSCFSIERERETKEIG